MDRWKDNAGLFLAGLALGILGTILAFCSELTR